MDPSEDFSDYISDWPDLAKLIEYFSYYNAHDWLFRGVRNADYELKATIGRASIRATKAIPPASEPTLIPHREKDERAILTMFKQQARPFLDSSPASALEWLAIAQHHGLPTRLLDWTDGLLVAAWFAVESGDGNSAIWITKHVPSVALDCVDDPFEFETPVVYRPPHINPRMPAQGSVLMICPNPTMDVSLSFLRKVTIASNAKFTIRKRLNACGINKRQLFPDLGGLSEHLAWMYKHDWLTAYRGVDGIKAADVTKSVSPSGIEHE